MGKRKRAEDKKGKNNDARHKNCQQSRVLVVSWRVVAWPHDGERSSEEQTDSGDEDYAQDEEESSDDEVEYGRQVCDPPGPPVPPADRHADPQGPVSRKEMRTVLRVCQKTQDLSKKSLHAIQRASKNTLPGRAGNTLLPSDDGPSISPYMGAPMEDFLQGTLKSAIRDREPDTAALLQDDHHNVVLERAQDELSHTSRSQFCTHKSDIPSNQFSMKEH